MQKARLILVSALGLLLVVILAGASCQRETINANDLVGDSLYKGNADAKVTIVEFSDFLCPACKIAHTTIGPVLEKYDPSEVRFVHKNFLIHADDLAIAASCVQRQDADLFWEYSDYLFENQGKVSGENVLSKTKVLFEEEEEEDNFDNAVFEKCYTGRETEETIEKDHQQGLDLGVDATPTFIINDKVLQGAPRSAEQFREFIDSLLAESGE